MPPIPAPLLAAFAAPLDMPVVLGIDAAALPPLPLPDPPPLREPPPAPALDPPPAPEPPPLVWLPELPLPAGPLWVPGVSCPDGLFGFPDPDPDPDPDPGPLPPPEPDGEVGEPVPDGLTAPASRYLVVASRIWAALSCA